jgi:phage portal protein BeeE
MDDGFRRYRIGGEDVTPDIRHIRYQAAIGDAHGHGPLEAGRSRVVAAQMLAQYATKLASGMVPPGILVHPEEQDDAQALKRKSDWVAARMASVGEPAVLSGGIEYKQTVVNPRDLALVELQHLNESRIAVLMGVPPNLIGLPTGTDPLLYKNQEATYDFHWRAHLRPRSTAVLAALSAWLLPRGTAIELNSDAYVRPGPLERAQTAQILNSIVDPLGNPALTVDEIRAAERLTDTAPKTGGPIG